MYYYNHVIKVEATPTGELTPHTTMDTSSDSVTIDRSAEEFFAFLVGAENVPRWNYAVEPEDFLGPPDVARS